MSPSFPSHGHFKLSLDGNILVNHARGPWNTELAAAYGQAVSEAVKALYGKPWGVLAFVSGVPIHTPEAKDRMVAALLEHRAHGRSGTALIFDVPQGLELLKRIHTAIYQAAGEPFLFADDEATARAWLAQRLISPC